MHQLSWELSLVLSSKLSMHTVSKENTSRDLYSIQEQETISPLKTWADDRQNDNDGCKVGARCENGVGEGGDKDKDRFKADEDVYAQEVIMYVDLCTIYSSEKKR